MKGIAHVFARRSTLFEALRFAANVGQIQFKVLVTAQGQAGIGLEPDVETANC